MYNKMKMNTELLELMVRVDDANYVINNLDNIAETRSNTIAEEMRDLAIDKRDALAETIYEKAKASKCLNEARMFVANNFSLYTSRLLEQEYPVNQ